jgi:hypothetical protein
MLADENGEFPKKSIFGINGGYDYRVDSWNSLTPHDNICYARYSKLLDVKYFYSHPAMP